MQGRGFAAAIIASLVGAGFSAQALGPEDAAPTPKSATIGYETDDHFPGAAFYTAVDDDAAIGAGATGTTQLPDMPIPTDAALNVDGSIQPAAPFPSIGTATDKARALQCLTTAIYYEAASEPDNGQRAVAQVVLNRVRHPAFPATVCGVVFQGSEKRVCQFSFACDGAMARQPSRAAWVRASRVAMAALSGSVFAPVGMATHYHTYAVTPSWNKSLVMTGVHGAHFFHRWKGWWGTASAFRQPYTGFEPLPIPHPQNALALPLALAAFPAVPMPGAVATPAPVPAALSGQRNTPTAREAIQPAYAESGTALTAMPGNPAQSDSQVLDKWKDSGKPIQ